MYIAIVAVELAIICVWQISVICQLKWELEAKERAVCKPTLPVSLSSFPDGTYQREVDPYLRVYREIHDMSGQVMVGQANPGELLFQKILVEKGQVIGIEVLPRRRSRR